MRKLQSNNFDEYPHYVYATAFMLDNKLMDYKIGNAERDWFTRTFRGLKWEQCVWEKFDKLNLYCKYNRILVNNREEHNNAFDILEKWLEDLKNRS